MGVRGWKWWNGSLLYVWVRGERGFVGTGNSASSKCSSSAGGEVRVWRGGQLDQGVGGDLEEQERGSWRVGAPPSRRR